MLCQRHQIVEVGAGPMGLVLGEIKAAFIDDELIEGKDANGEWIISPEKLNPLARLGGDGFGELGRVFEVERPD